MGKKKDDRAILLGVLAIVEMKMRHGRILVILNGDMDVELWLVGHDEGKITRGGGGYLDTPRDRLGGEKRIGQKNPAELFMTGLALAST
jgi:hypothetical protein